MADAKIRLLVAERIIGCDISASGNKSLDIEFCFLQIRRIIENITFGAMLREEDRYRESRLQEKAKNFKDHGNAEKDWQAEDILKRLTSLSPHVLPIPLKMPAEFQDGIFSFNRKNLAVNHSRLIDIYKKCGGFLHGKNPLGQDIGVQVNEQRNKYLQGYGEAQRALKFIRDLIWHHAAVTLSYEVGADPREAGSPKSAWILDFDSGLEDGITVYVAKAIANDSKP
jgi:hypothetical protein